jgi:uncharacterized protein (DUF1330 family)
MTPIKKMALALGVLLSASSALAADDTCDKPVDMIILSIVHDVERYQAYRASLVELGTLDRFGGKVLAVGTRLEAEPDVLEGDWPADRHSFVIRWPCAAAAHAFWQSETYQTQNLPLRVGAGTFNVALFPAVPEY